jgi:hypothetical protein
MIHLRFHRGTLARCPRNRQQARPHSIAPTFGPPLRLMGYPTPCFGDRLKLTDLVYRAVSPLRLDIPMRHVGCLYLSRLKHRPKSLRQDGRHANSPQSLASSDPFCYYDFVGVHQARTISPDSFGAECAAQPGSSFDCGNCPSQSLITDVSSLPDISKPLSCLLPEFAAHLIVLPIKCVKLARAS